MADNIVERLRAAARAGDLPLGVSFDCDAVADEIERLCAAGDALAEESWNNRSADEAVKAWWEVRNAE